MSGSYTVTFSNVAVSAQQDLIAVVAASTKPLLITGYGFSQTNRGGDAQEEILQIALQSGANTVGSGGNAVTPVANDSGGSAASFTARRNDTTKASSGTIVEHYTHSWNIRGEYERVLPEPMQILLSSGRRACLVLTETPGQSITMSGWMSLQEIG